MIPNEIMNFADEEIEISLVSANLNKHIFDYNIVRKNDGVVVGFCGINLDFDNLKDYLGNIVCEVFSEYRGNNYAYKATKLIGKVALYFGVENLNITVKPNNFASINTIQKLGARFICINTLLSNMKLYDGIKEYEIYNWKIEGEKLK